MIKINKFSREVLKQAVEFIRKQPPEIGDRLRQSLRDELIYLHRYSCQDDPTNTQCELYNDRAPLSFGFAMRKKDENGEYQHWFFGGLIYHGKIDGYGSGSVSVETVEGWFVHT